MKSKYLQMLQELDGIEIAEAVRIEKHSYDEYLVVTIDGQTPNGAVIIVYLGEQKTRDSFKQAVIEANEICNTMHLVKRVDCA